MPERDKKDSKKKPDVAEAEAVDSEPDGQGESAAAEVERATGLEVEVATLKDQLLRALAETENLRRRSQREREDAVKYAAAPLIKDLVGVVDNLRRAMSSVSSEALEADQHLKTFMTGLEMTETELNAVFEKHHIVRIEPLGERFDPHYHEAMYEIPDPETASGTVLHVLQPGYRLHGRLLRPAQVGVAAGGPAPAREAEPPAETSVEPPGEPNGDPEPAGGSDETPPGSTVDTTA